MIENALFKKCCHFYPILTFAKYFETNLKPSKVGILW